MKRRNSRREMERDVQRVVGGRVSTDPLAATLLPPGHRSLAVGRESGELCRDGVSRHDDPYGSTRYLYSEGGEVVSGLQVVSRDGVTALVANVYTRPDRRGRGLASELLARARHDFARVDHASEADLSAAGRGWRDAVERRGRGRGSNR
jgi:GNAT superfamily N-acetyltransferase